MSVGPLLQSGGSAGTIVFIILVLLLVHLALIMWVYMDAQKNSDHPAFLWAIVIFLAPLLGLVLYFLLGRTTASRSTGEEKLDRYTHECENCGKRYNAPQTDKIPTCHRCGGINVREVGSR